MKNILVIFFGLLFCFETLSSWSQAPPCTGPGFSTCKCSTSPVLCSIEELDGFSFSMGFYSHPQDGPSPLCPPPLGNGTAPHGPIWYNFIATCTNVELEICFNKCIDNPNGFGISYGIQTVVYNACPATTANAISCGAESQGCVPEGCRLLQLNSLSLGSTYYLMIDGCAGAACDVTINVIGDCGGPDFQLSEIEGPEYICPPSSDTFEYFHPWPIGASTLYWYIDNATVQTGGGNQANILRTVWDTPGVYELCFDASWFCSDGPIPAYDEPDPTCINVTVGTGVMIMGDSMICSGNGTGLSAGFGFATYLWNTGETTEEIWVTKAGVYSVTVTDANGCSGFDQITVTGGSNLNVTITGDTVLCNVTNGKLNAGSGFLSYLWSTGQTSPMINIQSAGIYSVTVSDFQGCIGVDSVAVTIVTTPKAVAGSNSPVCLGKDIKLSSSGGKSYAWTGPLGFQSKDQNPFISNAKVGMAGVYRVVVSNGGTCVDTAFVNVSLGTGGDTLDASALIPECPGDTLFLFAKGGNSYLWSGPDSFTSILQNPFIPVAGPKNSGIYIVSDTSVQGCALPDTISINIPGGPIPEIKGNLFICKGEEAILDAGPGFKSYLWSNGKRGRIMKTSDPGYYWVMVSDSSCCLSIDSVEVVINDKLLPDILGDTLVCEGDTSSLDAGLGYVSYLWNTGDTVQVINVFSPGIYHVTVTNQSGCIGTDTVDLKVFGIPQVIIEALQISCKDSCDGELRIVPAEQGYQYKWSNGDSSQVLTNLCSGLYLVTVTNQGGCSSVFGGFVPAAIPLMVTIDKVANTLIALPSGGVPPYSYKWNTGETTQSSSASPPGFHAVTVTDSKSCTASANIVVTNINEAGIGSHGIKLHPNPADGSLMISPNSGNTFQDAFEYEIFNVLGVKLAEGRIQAGWPPLTLDTSPWASGGYVMKVIHRVGGSETIPFIILH